MKPRDFFNGFVVALVATALLFLGVSDFVQTMCK